ncbi:MAG: hypothetical protein IKO31_06140 [Bacteroidales bacterium]|nr:hypothetical protein [Bacteroidales bacterium]
MDSRQKQILEYRSYPRGYYHLCTDGWHGGKLFNTQEQFALGMTTIALLTLKFGVQIISFELMPNHIHIILAGNGSDCLECFRFIMARIRKRLKADGCPLPPEDYWFKLVPIEDKKSLKKHIVYLARNKYEKGDCTPVGHIWGTGYLVYNQLSKYICGVKVKDCSKHKVHSITESLIELPADWEIHPDLGVLPKNFARTDKILELFPSVKAYMTAMIKDYEAYVKLSESLGESITWDIAEVRQIVSDKVMAEYRQTRIQNLTPDQKGRIAVLVFIEYGIDIGLIADALYLPEHIVNQFVNSKDYGKRKK